MKVSDLLRRQANNTNVVITCGKERITYSEMHNRAEELSKRLNLLKGGKYERVIVFLPNSIEYAISYFAILYSECVVVPLLTQSTNSEIVSLMNYCDAHIIITQSKYKFFLSALLNENKNRVQVIYLDTLEIVEYGVITQENEDDEILRDVVVLLHTSGTTSNPKRVMLTNKSLLANIQSNIKSLQINKDEVSLICLPMGFGYCNTAQFLTHIYMGARMVILDEVTHPMKLYETISKEKISNMTVVPTILGKMVNYVPVLEYDISSLKLVCYGGAPIRKEIIYELVNRFPNVSFVQTYGQTECSPRVTALLHKDALRKIGSVGKPIPGVKIKTVDEFGDEVGVNVCGEVMVSGKNLMKGYFRNEEATKNVLVGDWIRTGDIGYIDEEGYLYLKGRKKNIIISGGINIYPEEIEEVIMETGMVEECLVVPEGDSYLGEVPVAYINFKEGKEESLLKEVKYHCVRSLSKYKVPQKFITVENIAKTYNGKKKR